MKVVISKSRESYILNVRSSIIKLDVVLMLEKIFKSIPKNNPIALNMQNVNFINEDFLIFLKQSSADRKISLMNLQSELYVLLNLTNYDKYAKIFISENDFLDNKRAIINRKFSVLSNF